MTNMLELAGVTAGYGDSTVLYEVNFSVGAGEVVALLGPNGAGKTTLLRAATGFVKPRSGRITFNGEDFTRLPAHAYVRRGVCHLPEGRGIFPSLTVMENLTVQARSRKPKDAVNEVAELFPVLANRLGQTAGSLSGGEQQMLALSRAYLTKPKLVLVDEPSLGLAPLVIDKIYDVLARFVAEGMSVVIVEQYVPKALSLAQTVCILTRGKVIRTAKASEIAPQEIYANYLGVS